ncbi:hypothetical protein OH77DRAFT_1147982 [Trametes cingulata]|nr:hypothetical protein OH77DRAFT_1147982 [Trametes cingulata]
MVWWTHCIHPPVYRVDDCDAPSASATPVRRLCSVQWAGTVSSLTHLRQVRRTSRPRPVMAGEYEHVLPRDGYSGRISISPASQKTRSRLRPQAAQLSLLPSMFPLWLSSKAMLSSVSVLVSTSFSCWLFGRVASQCLSITSLLSSAAMRVASL